MGGGGPLPLAGVGAGGGVTGGGTGEDGGEGSQCLQRMARTVQSGEGQGGNAPETGPNTLSTK